MHKTIALVLLAFSTLLSGCKPAPEPLPPPTAEAVETFVEAALDGKAPVISAALKNGMPVDQKNKFGNSALMAASFNGHVNTMKTLITAGADVNLRVNNGVTPLMAACGPFPAAVQLLLDNGANVNATDHNENFTALMYAATEGLSPIVDILLKAGADPSMKDVDGDTAASFARNRGFTALADHLQTLIDAN